MASWCPRRSLPERISAAERRATRLAHRLYRIGRRRRHPRRARGAVRRRPLYAPGRRPDRPKLFTIEHLVDKPPSAWIESNLKAGQKLGFDPWLHTAEAAERLAKACSTVGAIMVATEPNPIDAACRNRPAPPHGAIVPHDLQFAGEPAAQKLERIRAEIRKLNADALVVSDPHAVAWTFNIRGADVSHTPLPLAFAIIRADGARLYVDESKLTDAARDALAGLADIRSEDTFAQDLAALGAGHLVVARSARPRHFQRHRMRRSRADPIAQRTTETAARRASPRPRARLS